MSDELRELRMLGQRATPEPWVVGVSWDSRWHWPVLRLAALEASGEDALIEEAKRDALFIEKLVNSFDELAAEYERMALRIAELETALAKTEKIVAAVIDWPRIPIKGERYDPHCAFCDRSWSNDIKQHRDWCPYRRAVEYVKAKETQ